MKRKRGPVPRGNKRKHKREVVEEQSKLGTGSEVDSDADGGEESFHGFSSDEYEDIDEKDKPTATTGGTGRTAKKEKNTAPTKDELIDVFLRSSSFQSNLFKLQTEELLSEVRVKYDKMTQVETVLHRLKEVIMAIPVSREQLVRNSRLATDL